MCSESTVLNHRTHGQPQITTTCPRATVIFGPNREATATMLRRENNNNSRSQNTLAEPELTARKPQNGCWNEGKIAHRNSLAGDFRRRLNESPLDNAKAQTSRYVQCILRNSFVSVFTILEKTAPEWTQSPWTHRGPPELCT